MRDMQLGIAVVYYQKDPDLSLLQVHLSKIEEYTRSDYTIFAGNNGLPAAVIEFLTQTPRVSLFDPPVKPGEDPNLSRSQQISIFTDYLVQKAINAGSTHVAIMHIDSFPVRDGWDLELADKLTEQQPFAAVLRRENLDTVLPFPACIFFTDSFYQQYKPTMYPEDTPAYQDFLTENDQLPDCGIGYSYAAHEAGLSWYPLLRSNQNNDYPIISGIYGDLIFHLGGGTRAELGWLTFRKDHMQTKMIGGGHLLGSLESVNLKARIKHYLKRILNFSRYRRLKELQSSNQAAIRDSLQRLAADPDAYLHYLRSGEEQ